MHSIVISRLTCSEQYGYPVEYYCPRCGVHTFVYDPWMCKPSDGDYFRIRLCPDHQEHNWEWTKIAGVDVKTREMKWSAEALR